MHQRRCGDEADCHALLTGCQPKAETNMRLAGAAVSHSDNVLITGDVVTARQFHHQHLVQRRHSLEVEAVETFDGRELCGFDPSFHHASFAVDEFQFGKAQKIPGMINALGGALPGNLVVFPQEGWQPQNFKVMGQQ